MYIVDCPITKKIHSAHTGIRCPLLCLATCPNSSVAPSDAILKYEFSTENKAVNCPERTKIVCAQGPGAHVCARVHGRDLVLGHRRHPRIPAWVTPVIEKKGVFTLAPNEYRTRVPCLGTKCERCLRCQFSSSLILQYSDDKYNSSVTKFCFVAM